jgi:hypothetical protein
MTQAQEAARWMVLMDAGLANVTEIVWWADEQIIDSVKPHPALIEISTSNGDAFDQVYQNLNELRPDVDRFEALRFAAPTLRLAIEGGLKRAEAVAMFTFSYLCGDESRIPPDMRFLSYAEDEFYLAIVENRGSRASVENQFIAALRSIERA